MVYISLDVEASGPLPCFFDLLSIGAVALTMFDGQVLELDDPFYVELKPYHGTADPGAMAVHGLDPERLAREGKDLETAARELRDWVHRVSSDEDPPVFVGYCANFDWAYINDLFHRAGMENPFGYKALDLRSLALGLLGLGWEELRQEQILPLLGLDPLAPEVAHNALADARHQARMLIRLLERCR
ncbi:MAG: 3'-5' exoribonuclease [Planctomycetota bacterium]